MLKELFNELVESVREGGRILWGAKPSRVTQIETITHIGTCAQLEKRPCPSGVSLHSEKPGEHWWSGWPGAYCMKCGDEDKDEVCIGGCECPCHAQFWKDYQRDEERAMLLDLLTACYLTMSKPHKPDTELMDRLVAALNHFGRGEDV